MQGQNTWKDRFSLLSPWFADIMTVVKKDCKQEHLRLDPQFVRQHFQGKPIPKISTEDMRAVYLQQILAGQDKLAEFISNRWIFRNMDVYRYFESELQKISPNFEQIQELTIEQASQLLDNACAQFGSEKVFCFVIINEVVVPSQCFDELQRNALEKLSYRQKNEDLKQEDDIHKKHAQEVLRIKQRYEKKIAELSKKHQYELNQLRIEIAQLRSQVQAQTIETRL